MRKFYILLLTILFLITVVSVFFYFQYKPTGNPTWGLTFSYAEAKGLGFDPQVMYLDILSDLKPKNLRLMTYWEDTEKVKGKYDFGIVDEQLTEAQKQNINVILVVGRKQPRWPECHQPDWYNNLSESDQKQAVLDMIKATVEHFRSNVAVKAWQVENEPYFGFGPNCPKSFKEFFDKEVALVKTLDTKPIVVTDSGDRGSWVGASKSGADLLGVTFYRVSYDKKFGGYYKYPIPAIFYRIKAGMLQTFVPGIKDVLDAELQMEPWFTNGALNTPLDLQKTLMNAKVFDQNIKYAEASGISTHYLWGVEWWYWMAKKNNDWGMWQAAKNLLSS